MKTHYFCPEGRHDLIATLVINGGVVLLDQNSPVIGLDHMFTSKLGSRMTPALGVECH